VDPSFVAAWLHRTFFNELLESFAWDQSASANLYARQLHVSKEITRLRDAQPKVLGGLFGRNKARELIKGHAGHASPPLRELYVSFRDELHDFRERHKLKRAARNPARRWTTFGLLFLLIGVEAGLNGFFFAIGSEFGLLGGVGTAIGISFVNVMLAFIVGLFPMRWLNHRNYLIKLVGLIVTLVGLACLVALHGFAAHYRDATAAVGEDRAFATALQTLKASPLVLANLNSFYLFGIGLLWAFLAIWKGVSFDDPYPRYGAHYRRTETVREDYSDEHALLFEDLVKIKDDTVTQLEAGIGRIPRFPQEASLTRAQRDADLKSFQAYESAVERAVNQLLSRYRDANRSHRKSTPAPKHFDTPWQLPHSFLC
jgi:hypothetical protein